MTRRGFASSLAMMALFAVTTSCVSEDQPSVHLVTAYQLRYGTSSPLDPRSIDNLDGLGGYEMSCKVGSKVTKIQFAASNDDDSWLFKLKSTSSECKFTVQEDNIYERECEISKSESVDCSQDDFESPCRVAITDLDGTTVRGLICCKAFPIQGNNPKDNNYSIYAPGSGDKPVKFTVYNCDKE